MITPKPAAEISIGIEESGEGVELAVWIDRVGGEGDKGEVGEDGGLEMVPVERVPIDVVLSTEE